MILNKYSAKKIILLLFSFLILVFIGIKLMTTHSEAKTSEVAKHGQLLVGRSSIDVFEAYEIQSSSARYDEMILRVNNSISEKSFLDWSAKRWDEIKLGRGCGVEEFPNRVYKETPHAVWFKFNGCNIGDKESPRIVYFGEGGVWVNNRMLHIAPGGDPNADKSIPKIIKKVSEASSSSEKNGFCLDFYCIDAPISKNETANIKVAFPSVSGLRMMVKTETYTTEQNLFYSRRESDKKDDSVEDSANSVSGLEYRSPSLRKINGIEGEENISGYSVKIKENEYMNIIQARWYHPGTSGVETDPEVEINLIYELRLNHEPSSKGWFDRQTVKETGFSAEKFLSMWEATLKSFKIKR